MSWNRERLTFNPTTRGTEVKIRDQLKGTSADVTTTELEWKRGTSQFLTSFFKRDGVKEWAVEEFRAVTGNNWIYDKLSSHPSILAARATTTKCQIPLAWRLACVASSVSINRPLWRHYIQCGTVSKRETKESPHCTDRRVNVYVKIYDSSRVGNPLLECRWVELELRWNRAAALGHQAWIIDAEISRNTSFSAACCFHCESKENDVNIWT